jgi:hypothetical protein
MPAKRWTPARVPLLALGIAALLGGLWGGLLRLGWQVPVGPSALVAFHGPLMVSGFLGTVIGLERAVALGRRAGYLAPLVTGIGALALVLGAPATAAALLVTLGSLGLVAIFVVFVRRQRELFMATMALGALAWLAGNFLWLAGWPIHRAVPWWMAFLTLTIAGERLELTRLLRVSPASRRVFTAISAALVLGPALALVHEDAGARLAGAAMAALAVWLGRQDIARRTVRQLGLTRFTALCLLSGYVWLGIGGLLLFGAGAVTAGLMYDAVLHAVFVGFVMAMIFGHAPIIFPAVLGRPMPFSRRFYAHLVLLHASLALRVAGDLTGWIHGRQCGGLFNTVAIALFLASTVAAIVQGSLRARNDARTRGA